MIRNLFLFLNVFFLASAVLAASSVKSSPNQTAPTCEVKTADGLSFKVPNAVVGENDGIKYLLVEFTFSNLSETKKVDFNKGFEFSLSDKFGNNYREIPKPAGFQDPVEKKEPGFPSIYPSESYSKRLFFEPPILKAELLKLDVKALDLNVQAPIIIDFPAPIPVVIKKPDTAIRKQATDPSQWVEILSPESGMVVTIGESFCLQVLINNEVLPQKLIIIAFGQTMDDLEPAADNNYDIAIPAGSPEGQASLSVIAQWNSPDSGKKEIFSKDVVIYVRNQDSPPLL